MKSEPPVVLGTVWFQCLKISSLAVRRRREQQSDSSSVVVELAATLDLDCTDGEVWIVLGHSGDILQPNKLHRDS